MPIGVGERGSMLGRDGERDRLVDHRARLIDLSDRPQN